jgi:hypothetical protein
LEPGVTTGLKNALLPTLFKVVNNIAERESGAIMLNNIFFAKMKSNIVDLLSGTSIYSHFGLQINENPFFVRKTVEILKNNIDEQ